MTRLSHVMWRSGCAVTDRVADSVANEWLIVWLILWLILWLNHVISEIGKFAEILIFNLWA